MRPWVSWTLLGLCGLAFAVTLLLGGGLMQVNGRVHAMLGANFGPLTLQGEWWRLITCQFLHFGAIHLAFNAMALFQLGPLAEHLYGRWHFLVLYLVAGIGGGFGTLLWNPEVNSAGASGAIFGVIGGLLAFVSRRDLGVPLRAMLSLRRSFVTFGGISLAAGFLLPGVDNAAHVGGLATGFVAGHVLARPIGSEARVRPDFVRPVLLLALAGALFFYLATALGSK
jgi:rhomboid protease GluP